MKTTHLVLTLAASLALVSHGSAQDAALDVQRAIEELGSRDDAAVASAAETLRIIGVPAEPSLLAALDGATGAKKDRIQDLLRFMGHVTDEELLALEKKVVAAIRGSGNKHVLEAGVAREIEQFAIDHAPPSTRTHTSTDGTIVITIGRTGKPGEEGGDAYASDGRASLVIAIGGGAGALQGNVLPRAGDARAQAAGGIAIAIGGRGASGGGAGGNAAASSPGGEVAVGGPGGQGVNDARRGATGSASGTSDARALKDQLR